LYTYDRNSAAIDRALQRQSGQRLPIISGKLWEPRHGPPQTALPQGESDRPGGACRRPLQAGRAAEALLVLID